MIAAIYARKSTSEPGVAEDAKSVTRQIERATAYATKKGWVVDDAHIYVDDGISGAEFEKRPGLMRLLNALKPRQQPPFQVLITAEASRLGRESIQTGYVMKTLILDHGIRVFFYLTDEEPKLLSATDKFLVAVAGFASEIEREKTGQRTRDALARRASAGHVAGGRCFGYDNIEVTGPNGGRSHVERKINKPEAKVVVRAFELAARGVGMRRICWTLNEERALSPKSQRGRPQAWAPSSVRAMLYRPIYKGVVVWARTKKRDGAGRVHQRPRPESEWLRKDAPQLRIVSDALWDAAHAKLNATKQKYLRGTDGKLWGRPQSGVESKYLLPGLARCANCNGGMLVRTGSSGNGRKHFYACSSYHLRGTSVCQNGFMDDMAAVDRAVLQCVEKLFKDGVLDEVLDAAVGRLTPARTNLKADHTALVRALEKLDGEIERLTNAIASGAKLESVVDMLAKKEQERGELRRRVTGSEVAQRRADVTPARLRETLAARFKDWRGVLQRHPMQARQIIKKLLVEPLKFTPKKGYYEFEGSVSFAKLLTEVNFPIMVASPPGFEPGFQP